MGTYCAPLVADLFICYAKDFTLSLSDSNHVTEAVHPSSKISRWHTEH